MLFRKQGLSSKQRRKIYQCCVRPGLLYCCETWEITMADEVRLRWIGTSYDQDDVWGETGR